MVPPHLGWLRRGFCWSIRCDEVHNVAIARAIAVSPLAQQISSISFVTKLGLRPNLSTTFLAFQVASFKIDKSTSPITEPGNCLCYSFTQKQNNHFGVVSEFCSEIGRAVFEEVSASPEASLADSARKELKTPRACRRAWLLTARAVAHLF